MIYIVLAIALIGLLIFSVTNVLQQQISTTEHPGYVRALIFGSFVVILGFFIVTFFEETEEALIPNGFTEIDSHLYVKDFDGYQVTINYDPHGKSKHSLNRADRVVMSIQSNLNRDHIAKLFCSEAEFEDFLVSDREWFPTKHKKLANGYYVGECYPPELVTEIEKLEPATHGFEPRYARYLFIPTIDKDSNYLLLKLTDENIQAINDQIENFLNFYRIYMPN
ncbi:hypothetical protein FLL45_17735 [Aliikangiella marina]|uniref:Uncharacterized protein n=1 Tax=Aliikangiella marina TaxID=1712262 RepID=A0A545T4A6_9GAMM|nr:hypothetical protein [Aliikangiella marina]TQV72010.1 hypothetical protein FLL45_17455 [Aliikangiella marina]TQV72063.1 hypothetical protein FLL45_17735 [Aliikangiella marina]